ncbi:peptidylprolyl isomerase [Pelagimonas varians]|uniref:Parvulin-like PPIase n=1 Tax=Pelagimonas varians TaxID=696760 RepID=A0A238K6F9_9RHOB|nr:peptidylprolyl isomerase [Pelagimonas varians]PYG31867.1 peptidyl-prolyl cis-trans isomerase D [Pelagimonas varians]SMX38490.1 Peptidyl-prolyl cis-trans isomerase D [Pelagimonas varians]
MAEKKTSIGKMMIYGLMALLFVGLGGFGATNFSGGVRSVGHVGEVPISVQDYSNGLRNQIRAVEAQSGQPLPFQQAQAAGLPQQVLAQVVVATALESEAATLGISVGDDRLADEIVNTQAFHGVNGQFDRQAYEYALQNIGMRERDFEEGLRSESAATILQGSVLAGIKLPDTYVDTLVSFSGERRAFTWAELGPETLTTGMPVPTDEQLTAWYEENIADYTRPETKSITFAWLTPDMILDTVEVDDASLREAYTERESEFNMPERRLVERLVYGDDAEAQAAVDRVAAGEATFEQLVAERDLTLADTDMGDVTTGDLGPAADLVFAAEVGTVAGPAPSDLGPAVFRVNAVLPEQSTTFEEATPDLRDALALDRARRTIEQQAQDFDDQLAAGATLEELAETTDLQLGTIGWTGQDTDGDIAGYEDFREAAQNLNADDYPTVAELGDGGLFAMRLEEILSPAPLPFEDVRAAVELSFERSERSKALLAEAEALAEQLTAGKSFEDLSLTANTQEGLTRTAYGADLSADVLTAVFEMEPGAIRAISGGNGALLVRLDEILPADTEGENAQMLANLFGNQAVNDVSQDLFRALSADIQQRAGVNIDQQAINAVHVNFQ